MEPPDEPQARHGDEVDLARRVTEGDRTAAEALATRLLPVVRTVARRLTTSEADAADAAQVALLEILRSARNYSGAGSLEGWARTIAARAVLRWRGVHARAVVEYPRDDPASFQPSTAVVDELPRPLPHYLEELSMAQREAVALRFVAQCTIPEIAELTGAPVPTVKSRIVSGLDRLRKSIRRDIELGVRAS